MELATTLIVSPFLEALFDSLIKSVLQMDNCSHGLKEEVASLNQTIVAISQIHDDAEQRQLEGYPHLIEWMQHLKVELYNARDVVEEVNYKYWEQQCAHLSQVRNSPMIAALSLNRLYFGVTMTPKIVRTRETLDRLRAESSVFNLQRRDRRRPLETTSIGDKNFFGREKDSKTILKFLLTNDSSTPNVQFIAICGRGGLGKTKLAQVLFNHDNIVRHFHTRTWVHASFNGNDDTTNVKELIKATIESITRNNCDLQSLDTMQQQLRQLLKGKNYLLVLDDIVIDRDGFLLRVRDILTSAGVNGSKILITTQKRSISTLMLATHTHELKSLCRDDCAQVIEAYAFCDRNSDAYQDLNRITEKIVDRCKGLPSIAKNYGILLMKTKREEWESISKKEVTEVIKLEYDISQALPPTIKRCFAYCSIFPKDFKFDRGMLAQQWWVQGFVSTEDDGKKCFDSMINWSLFHHSCFDPSKTQQTYTMHDDVRYRAQLIAGEECYMMCVGNNRTISKSTYHASLLLNHCQSNNLSDPYSKTSMESICEATNLHTLILLASPTNQVRIQVPENLPNKLKCLRTLDLSHTDLHELPSSIGDLKHLRYLSLCNTKIKRLPDSVTKLYLIQSLGLRNCYELVELPKDTGNLRNLSHIDLHLDDLRRSRLTSMPRRMRKLLGLRTLSRFVVSKNRGCGIGELGSMRDLRGHLVISGLENVLGAADSQEATLELKEHLQMLELRWGDNATNSHVDEDVLSHLRPHTNLVELRIGGYRDYFMPTWIGDESFSSLVSMKLYNCKNLSTLPPLERLPSLKKLQLEGLPRWKSWVGHDDCKFTSLEELVVRNCTSLSQMCPDLSVLEKLEIDRCPSILGLPKLVSLHSLKVKDSGEWIWDSLRCLKNLDSLVLSGLPTTTPAWGLQSCTHLRRLEISNCRSLKFLQDDSLPSTLNYLKVECCPRLEALPSSLKNLKNLEELQIQHCNVLQSLPTGMKCLSYFELSDCPEFSCLPSDGLPAGLYTLSINNCPKLEECLAQDQDIVASIQSVWINGNLQTESSHSGASTS